MCLLPANSVQAGSPAGRTLVSQLPRNSIRPGSRDNRSPVSHLLQAARPRRRMCLLPRSSMRTASPANRSPASPLLQAGLPRRRKGLSRPGENERERFVATAEGGQMKNALALKSICGTYIASDTCCGRKVYRKEPEEAEPLEVDILLYYWDDRDGQDYSGWWFGRQLGGQQVWGHCNSHAQTPPEDNWKIPWDGPVEEADLQETAEEMKEIKGQAASIPVPRQKLDSISILEELQEFRNRLADCCQRLDRKANIEHIQTVQNCKVQRLFSLQDTEAANLQKQQKEIEDAALRQEEAQETRMLLPDFISTTLMLANEAEDQVEKAQITKTMEDHESATQALDQLQTAVSAAQFGLDSAKTSLQAKEAEIENLPPFAHESAREELLRLRQQIQQAQVTLQPLKTTRQDWERRRTSQKVIAQVEQKLVLAEVEAEQTTVMLKDGPRRDINATEVISQELLGDAKKAVRSVERTTTAASSHLHSRRALLQSRGSIWGFGFTGPDRLGVDADLLILPFARGIDDHGDDDDDGDDHDGDDDEDDDDDDEDDDGEDDDGGDHDVAADEAEQRECDDEDEDMRLKAISKRDRHLQ
eukprot:s194_g15.t1